MGAPTGLLGHPVIWVHPPWGFTWQCPNFLWLPVQNSSLSGRSPQPSHLPQRRVPLLQHPPFNCSLFPTLSLFSQVKSKPLSPSSSALRVVHQLSHQDLRAQGASTWHHFLPEPAGALSSTTQPAHTLGNSEPQIGTSPSVCHLCSFTQQEPSQGQTREPHKSASLLSIPCSF